MASIVHVTDKDMIEFHRLNGNDSFNFWRAGSKMKFTDFKVGDTLFFLANHFMQFQYHVEKIWYLEWLS